MHDAAHYSTTALQLRSDYVRYRVYSSRTARIVKPRASEQKYEEGDRVNGREAG